MPWSQKQKAKRCFDIAFPIADDDALIDFQDALDLINLAEMPPEDEPQPTDAEQRKVVAWFTAAIAKHQAERQHRWRNHIAKTQSSRVPEHHQ